MTRLFYPLLLLLPLSLSCDINPSAPSRQAQTFVVSYAKGVETEYQGRRVGTDSTGRFSWQHPDGIGGVQVVTVITETDSIRIGVDIRNDIEKNSITIHPRN